jgi:MFS family permease
MVILPEACPVKYRQFLGGLIGMVLAGSGVLGPVLGGVLTQYASWRWVFWIKSVRLLHGERPERPLTEYCSGPIGVISLAIFFFSWPKEGQLPIPPRRHWQNFDYLGSFFVIVAAVLVVFAFQEVAREGSWRSAIFIGPLISGLVSWGALVGWEAWAGRRFTDRISLAFPISLFRNRFYAAAATSTLFMGYPFLLIIFSFPTRAQVVSGKSAVIAGVMLLPMLASSSVATIISGKINSDKDRYFVTIFAGACFMTIGCGLLSTVRDSSDDSKALGFLVFTGLGFGMSTSASTMAGSLEASASDRGKWMFLNSRVSD